MSRKKIHPRWAHRFQPSRKTWFPWNQLWNDMLNGDLYWFIFLWGTVRRTSSSCLRVSSAANASRPTLSWRSIWTSTRPKTTRCPTSASTARNGFRTRRSRSRTATRCTPTRATSSAISAAKRFPLLFTRALGEKKGLRIHSRSPRGSKFFWNANLSVTRHGEGHCYGQERRQFVIEFFFTYRPSLTIGHIFFFRVELI